MKFGVCLTHYGREVGSAELVEAVEAIERLGFDSIWVTDHVVIPGRLHVGWVERQKVWFIVTQQKFTAFQVGFHVTDL